MEIKKEYIYYRGIDFLSFMVTVSLFYPLKSLFYQYVTNYYN